MKDRTGAPIKSGGGTALAARNIETKKDERVEGLLYSV